MFPYFSRHFGSSRVGTRIIGVDCEQCDCRYFYELTRIGIGSVSTPYGLGATAAEESANLQSAAELQVRLHEEAELVPCPRCHWINRELVAGHRLGRYRWAGPLAVGIAFFGTVAALIVAAFLWYGPRADHAALPYVLIGGPGVSIAIALLLVLARNVLRSRILPNRNFPAPPRLPAGVPPALLLDEATETFLPIERDEPGRPDECVWFDFQIGRHRVPDCCSQCLREASPKAVWTHPVTVAVQLAVPRCAECRRRARTEYLLAWPWAFVLSTGAGVGLLLLLSLDEMIFGILAVCHVLLSLGLAAYHASVQSAPVRLKIVDRGRGILRLRFRHPEYRPETVWTDQPDSPG